MNTKAQNDWIEAHQEELETIQQAENKFPLGAALHYGELVEEFWTKFHKPLTDAIAEWSKQNEN